MMRESKAFEFLELKTESEGRFTGYASTWSEERAGGPHRTRFLRRYHARVGRQESLFLNHDKDQWCGFSTSLMEDERGLYLEGKLALSAEPGRNAFAILREAKAIGFATGLSIGFIAQDWDFNDAKGSAFSKTNRPVGDVDNAVPGKPSRAGKRREDARAL